MMRSKTMRQKLIFMLLPLLLITLALLTIPSYAKAESSDLYESLKPICAIMTESDELEGAIPLDNGKTPTLENFIEKTKANEYGMNQNNDLEFNDRLYKIIPEEFFRNVGEWFYRGYDYSFYIETWEGLTADADYYSNVVIIDNTFEIDVKTAEIEIKVSIFSRSYSSDYSIFDNTFSTEDSGDTMDEFFLSDVSFTTSIFNEHQLNYGDDGYAKINDTGLVITQSRLNYSGIYNKTTKFNPVPLLVEGIDTAIGAIPIFGDIYGAISDVNKWVETASECFEDLSVTVENGNEANIFTNVTKENQLHDNTMESFITTVNAHPKEPGLLINESAQMIVLLNNSNIQTRILTGVSYNLYIGDLYDDYKIISDGDGTYKKVMLDKAYADSDKTDDFITSKYEDLLFNEIKKATVGENAGYLMKPFTEKGVQSEQDFQFVADRNGNYKIMAGNDFEIQIKIGDKVGSYQDHWIGRIDLGTKITIKVKGKDSSFKGVYNLNIIFTPEQIQYGENQRVVKGRQDEYFTFAPTESKIYSFQIKERLSSLVFRVDRVVNDSLENIAVGTRDLDIFLTSGYEYYIVIMNVGTSQNSFTMLFDEGITLEENQPSVFSVNSRRVLTFVPSHNGEFTLKASADYLIDISLYDSNFNKLFSGNIGNIVQNTQFYESDSTYFIEINGYDVNPKNVTVEINFTPPVTAGKSINLANITEYNIVKFVPQVSGKYTFTPQNSPSVSVGVYTNTGTDITGQSLSSGVEYYVAVKGNGVYGVLLEVTLSCDRLYNNTPHSVSSGKNTVAFIAPVSGTYSFSGLTSFTIFREDYTAIYNQYSNKINLEINTTYYVEFNSTNAGNTITLFFNPTDLNLSGNIVVNNTSYYEINPSTSGQYIFNAQSVTGTPIKLQLYNTNLELVHESTNQLVVNISANKYYLKIHIENIDTLLSVTSSATIDSSSTMYYEGTKISVNLTGGSAKVFKFNYNKIESKTRYYLKVNEVLGENLAIKIYFFRNGVVQTTSLIKTGEAGKYFCDIEKNVGQYYIEVQSANNKVLQLDFYVPASIQDVEINGKSIYGYINALYLGIGEEYSFETICNSNATYGAKMRIVSAPSGVSLINNRVVLQSNNSLVGQTVELAFETNDGNDYRMYLFEIKYPYTATAKIINNTYQLSFIDLYDNETYAKVYNSIEFYYYLESYYYSLPNNGGYTDLTYIPNIDSLRIYANVCYNSGYSELVSCDFSESRYGLGDNANLTGKTRLLIDARNSAASQSNTIIIPANIKNVNIWGVANREYRSINFVIESRTSNLVINLNNFSFTSNSAEAIKAVSSNNVTINLAGTSKIRTHGLGMSAINVPNLSIVGNSKTLNQLYIYGGPQNIYTYQTLTAGNGVSSNQLTIRGCIVYAYGGNGQNGYSYSSGGYDGANAGNAIVTTSLSITSSTVYLYGGTGADGVAGSSGSSYGKASNGYNGSNLSIDYANGRNGNNGGSGGKGGRGGNGGYALHVSYAPSVTGSSVYLYGGNSGNGGNGGRGGNGGSGGDAAPTANRPGSDDGGRGGSAGNGGRGGNGGAFGTYGAYSNLANISANSKTNGINGEGGQGGAGGSGGNGGKGGDDIQLSGTEGAGGNGGSGGNGGNGYFAPGGNGGSYGYGGSSGNAGGFTGNAGSGSSGSSGTAGLVSGTVYVSTSGSGISYKYYATITRTITLYTSGNSGDPYLEVYDSYGNRITYNDDGGEGTNSRLTITLNSYTSYAFVAKAYGNGTASYYLYAV